MSSTTRPGDSTSSISRGGTSYRMHIPPDVFLSRVEPHRLLRGLVEGCTAVVSPRDISRMMDAHNDPSRISILGMHMDELVNIFQRVQDAEGVNVYGKADIRTGRVSPDVIYHSQTFVQAEKIVGLGGLKRLFDHFDNPGIGKSPASIIVYEHEKVRYVALYFPVVVEYMNKSLIEPVLETLRVRAKCDPTLRLNAFGNGHKGTIALDRIVRETDALITNGEIHMIPMLRDGTHRSHNSNLAGTTMHAVIINGTVALPTGVPIKPSEMIVTSDKPEDMGDRFLGYMPKSWMTYKDLGIDG